MSSASSSSSTSRHSPPAIPKLRQICGDGGVQIRGLGLLLAERGGEPLHLLFERFAVVLDRLRSYVAPGREHMAVLADVVQLCGHAKAGNVSVLARSLVAPPGVVGTGDLRNVLVGQLAVRAVHHRAELARVEE